MPTHIRLIGRYGNGVLALLLGAFVLVALGKGQIGAALLLAMICGLAVFNVWMTEKAASFLVEEEWLKSEVRKAELREKLAQLTNGDASATAHGNT